MAVDHLKEEEFNIKNNIERKKMTKNEITESEDNKKEQSKKDAGPFVHKHWTELIKPKKIDVIPGEEARFGTVEIEPLERGFGMTLGNALRRTLLSLSLIHI